MTVETAIGVKSRQLAPIITLVVALGAAGIIVPLGQWLFEALATRTALAATRPDTQEAIFTVLVFGALLAVAAAGLTIAGRWSRLLGDATAPMAGSGLVIGVAGLLVTVGLASLATRIVSGTGHPGASALLAGTLLVLFQASVEEIYFRGWLQPVLSSAWGDLAGLLVTAAAFAMLHLLGGDRSLVTILNLLLGGLLFGLLAQRSGGIVLAVAAHFGWNWAESIGLGLDVNPGVGAFGAIHDIDIVGATIWGGSGEGLNASIAMTFVMVAVVIPAFVWRWRPVSDGRLSSALS